MSEFLLPGMFFPRFPTEIPEASDETEIDFDREMRAAVRQAEKAQTAALTDLSELRGLVQYLLENESRRQTDRRGDDHPRVTRLTALRAANLDALLNLQALEEAAGVQVARVDTGSALIHGRVIDENQRGLSGFTVRLEWEDESPIHELGEAVTDDAGYYALPVPAEALAKLAQIQGAQVIVRSPSEDLIQQHAAPQDLQAGGEVFFQVVAAREMSVPPRSLKRGGSKAGQKDAWVVSGSVFDASGKPLPGLLVSLSDKDRRYDDLLGAAVTNKQGSFTLTYRRQDFREGLKTGSDLFLLVRNMNGETLFALEKAMHFHAGEEEELQVVIEERQPPQKPAADEAPPHDTSPRSGKSKE